MTSGNNNSRVPENPATALYSVPIKGCIGKRKKTIFYVVVNGMGEIVQYSCKNITEMIEVTQEEVLNQIKTYLIKKKNK